MKSLAQQLARANFLSQEQADKHDRLVTERERTQAGHSLTSATKARMSTLVKLEEAMSVSVFKEHAKALLLKHPDLTDEVVSAAHRLPENEPGRKRLIWLVYGVRDGLAIVRPKFQKRFLERAFRKRNPTVEVAPEWQQ